MEEGFIVQYLTWNKKVREFLIAFGIAIFLLLLPLFFSMYPSKDSSLEMRTAYYILVVPKWVTDVFVLGIYGIMIYYFLRKIFLRKINGEIFLSDNSISFRSSKINFAIEIETLKSIHFVPKKAFQGDLLILTKKDNKRIFFKLTYDVQFENLFKQLVLFDDKIEIKVEPDDMISVDDEEGP